MTGFASFIRISAVVICVVVSTISISSAQQTMYWIGGSGSWTDLSHWSISSGGSVLSGQIPTADYDIMIDNNSGLNSNSVITIPVGTYTVNNFKVYTTANFELLFAGTSFSNSVEMNIYGDLALHPNFSIEYSGISSSSNQWKFVSENDHLIDTGNHDLFSVEFHNEEASYIQKSDLLASSQIKMFGGVWLSQGNDIDAGKILFSQGISTGNPLTKEFYADESIITCDEWDSKLTYGTLVVHGQYSIRASKFVGSPKSGSTNFYYDEIILLEYPDSPTGGSIVEHNNFACTECIIEDLIIEDTGDTKLAGLFTINNSLRVENPGSTIKFNGGNSYSDEVIINGSVITPLPIGCDSRTIFTNVHDDFTTLTRSSGTLLISNAIINNIVANGNATFNISEGVLQGVSSGWNLVNTPSSLTYTWAGINGQYNNWNDPNNWKVGSQSNGCIPSIVDNVMIDNSSEGLIRIPAGYTAECKNFYWLNEQGLDLKLDGTSSMKSTLKVTGDFETHPSANFTSVSWHEVQFSSNSDNVIHSYSVHLPEIKFLGTDGSWNLKSDMVCDELVFESGTLNTQGNTVTTDYWNCIENYSKHFDFSNSHIIVNGEMKLSVNTNSNVTVDHGISLIECESLTSSVENLYDVKFNNNTATTMPNYNFTFNKLILNGTGQITTLKDLTLKTLVFEEEGSTLALDPNSDFIVEGIESLTSQSTPAIFKSKTFGNPVTVDTELSNICVTGHVSFTDIDASFPGVFHAPQGIDNGNNTDIIYDSGSSTSDLYWIGDEGLWHVQSNWSRIDGGCPASKNPDNATNLYFNRNSFYSSPVTVSILSEVNANNVHFENFENLTIDVKRNSIMNTITCTGGYANFIGYKILDIEDFHISASGFITTNMINFSTETLDISSGFFVIRTGSKASIK